MPTCAQAPRQRGRRADDLGESARAGGQRRDRSRRPGLGPMGRRGGVGARRRDRRPAPRPAPSRSRVCDLDLVEGRRPQVAAVARQELGQGPRLGLEPLRPALGLLQRAAQRGSRPRGPRRVLVAGRRRPLLGLGWTSDLCHRDVLAQQVDSRQRRPRLATSAARSRSTRSLLGGEAGRARSRLARERRARAAARRAFRSDGCGLQRAERGLGLGQRGLDASAAAPSLSAPRLGAPSRRARELGLLGREALQRACGVVALARFAGDVAVELADAAFELGGALACGGAPRLRAALRAMRQALQGRGGRRLGVAQARAGRGRRSPAPCAALGLRLGARRRRPSGPRPPAARRRAPARAPRRADREAAAASAWRMSAERFL